MSKTIGLFAGSFDPMTYGHLNLIKRSAELFDELIVLIAVNTSKQPLFTEDERVQLVTDAVRDIEKVSVDVLRDGLVANYAKDKQVTAMVRGVRNTMDFEYEFTIASANRRQYPELETIILYAADEYRFLSSSIIKEIAYYQGDISTMVPPTIQKAIEKKYR